MHPPTGYFILFYVKPSGPVISINYFFLNLNFIYFTTITHGYKLAWRWSCWVENKYETFLVRENHWNFFPGWKTQTYSCWLWDSNPQPPSNSVVVITPRLAHRLNHSATGTGKYKDTRLCNTWNVWFLCQMILNWSLPFFSNQLQVFQIETCTCNSCWCMLMEAIWCQ